MVRVIEGNYIEIPVLRETKLLLVKRFELSRVRVTEDKITENV